MKVRLLVFIILVVTTPIELYIINLIYKQFDKEKGLEFYRLALENASSDEEKVQVLIHMGECYYFIVYIYYKNKNRKKKKNRLKYIKKHQKLLQETKINVHYV